MEDKLVTLAIHTFEKAQILKNNPRNRGDRSLHTQCEPDPAGSFGWSACAY